MRRPWGTIDQWIHDFGDQTWSFIGVAGFEDRSLACLGEVANALSGSLILHIAPASPRDKSVIVDKTIRMKGLMTQIHPQANFWTCNLSDKLGDFIHELERWLQNAGKNLIIDMSVMPKKYLGIVIAKSLRAQHIENVIVTYTKPEGYTQDSLAEDPGPISPLTGIGRQDLIDKNISKVVMGLGYMAFDLNSFTDTLSKHLTTNVLFPFPPGAPSFQRNWKLLHNLFGIGNDIPEPIRVDSRDVSYAFDVLDDLTENGRQMALLLPFGPKPHSLAMMLHAISRNSEIRYTQAQYYHPNYSYGIAKIGEKPETYGYAIRLRAKYLYGKPVEVVP